MILFLDTYNLYHAAMMQFGTILDYDKVLNFVKTDFKAKYAYVAETDSSRPFADYLRSKGFSVHQKPIRNNKLDSFDVDLALHACRAADIVDRLTICSGSVNLIPLLKLLHSDGKAVQTYGVGLPKEYRNYGYTREFTSKELRVPHGTSSIT